MGRRKRDPGPSKMEKGREEMRKDGLHRKKESRPVKRRRKLGQMG